MTIIIEKVIAIRPVIRVPWLLILLGLLKALYKPLSLSFIPFLLCGLIS